MLTIRRMFDDPERREEEGSIIIAILIIVILSVSLAAVLRSVQGGLKLARTDQNRTNAFQQASGGIDQALYRLDQSAGVPTAGILPASASGSYVPRLITGDDPETTAVESLAANTFTGWADHVTAGGIDYTITARATPPGQTAFWRVQSIGKDAGGRTREAVATLAADLLFKDGFFTLDGFNLTGNQHTPEAYDSVANPFQYTSKQNPYQTLLNTVKSSIGSNGTFTGSGVSHFATRWNGFNMYGRSTQSAADADCEGCSAAGAIVRPFADAQQINVPLEPSAPSPCPAGGVFTGTIAPGDYVCNNVTFQGTVTVASTGTARPVQCPSVDFCIRVWPKCRLYMDDSRVNLNQSPLKVQVYFKDPVNPPCTGTNDSSMCDAVVFGMLYTPGMTIDCNGSHQAFMYGAVVAHFYGGTGNQFEFYWDAASSKNLHTGKFRVYDWRECPAGVANC